MQSPEYLDLWSLYRTNVIDVGIEIVRDELLHQPTSMMMAQAGDDLMKSIRTPRLATPVPLVIVGIAG